MTEIFYMIGDSVNPMLEILPVLGNAPNVMIIAAGLVILVACTNLIIKTSREETQ